MSVRDADNPGAESTPPDPSTSPGTETGRSPMMSVVKAGSGALVPFTAAGEIRPLIFFVLRSPGSIPVGTMCTPDVHFSIDEARELALVNPARALVLAVGIDPAGVIRAGADLFVLQFLELLHIAQVMLDRHPGDEQSRADRIGAREGIDTLHDWAQMAMVFRSGGNATAPLSVPASIAEGAFELARIARRLRYHSREASLGRDPSTPNPEEASDQEAGHSMKKELREVQVARSKPVLLGGFLCGYDPTRIAGLPLQALYSPCPMKEDTHGGEIQATLGEALDGLIRLPALVKALGWEGAGWVPDVERNAGAPQWSAPRCKPYYRVRDLLAAAKRVAPEKYEKANPEAVPVGLYLRKHLKPASFEPTWAAKATVRPSPR